MADKDMKYRSIAALVEAYRSGELSFNDRLVLDNDLTFVYAGEECVYRSDPGDDFTDALDLLNIPWENC